MSARVTTYLALATGMGMAVGRPYSALDTAGKASFDFFLNNASRWAWRKPKDRPWPEALQSASKTPTAGVIALSDIAYAEHYRVWSADPRPVTSTAYRIDATRDADGIHLKADVSPVWVEYLPRVPEFTSTAYNAGSSYAVDDLIYYTDGNCYRCLSATSAGQNPVSAAAKWELQGVLKMLLAAVTYEGASQYYGSIGSDGKAADASTRAIEYIEGEWMTAFPKNANYSYPPLGWR